MEANREEAWKTEYEIAGFLKMRLYQRRHGLAAVLEALEVRIGSYEGEFWTDGALLYLDGDRLSQEFLKDSERLCLKILHILAHCLLGHLFRAAREREKDPKEWDRACDLAAWELAEQIWGEKISSLEEAELRVDIHEPWVKAASERRLAKASGDNGAGSDQEWWELQADKLKRECTGIKKRRAGTALRQRKRRLVPASGHRGDYREILQSFSSYREDSRINPEEFQYSWYEYGLQVYGNMPLIEPLEYREERKIEDLVLVIDTSASCEKELVRIFLEETKGILEQDQLFFRHFCLHIIQCDNRIQRDDRIGSREEFEAYLEDLQITGGGGTDFRPAFERIAELLQAGEFRDLKGVLYFTDGIGWYPKEEPDYEVYFVMLENNYDAIDMPDWIHRLILVED